MLAAVKLLLRCLIRLWFRFRTENTKILDTPGPVLLLPNHVSWFDWAFLAVTLGDDWKFVTSATTANASWIHTKIMVNRRTFPVDTTSPYAVKKMAEYLAKGGRLVLFPEGRITVTGSMMKLYDGTGFLLHKTGAKVITCYLRNAVRGPFVRHLGWTQWFPQVTAYFSDPIQPPKLTGISNTLARQKQTNWLRDQMIRQQFDIEMAVGPTHVLRAIAETAAILPHKVAIEDVSGTELTFRKLMVGTDVLADQWRLRGLGAAGTRVGVLLPNVNGMPVTVLSLWAAGYVPAILNFSTGAPVMLQCVELAGLKHIITSHQFLEKAKLDLKLLGAAGIQFVHLEEVRTGITGGAKFRSWFRHTFGLWARGVPIAVTVPQAQASVGHEPAVILFTSGSEGLPKGVELSHRNLLANIRQITLHEDISDDERFFNALPLFHSFGLTACTLFPLVRGLYTFLYPSPLHYRVVPAAVYDRNCTVMVGTNTFLNGYARKAHPYDFRSVKFLVAGAEKVQAATAETWARKFGIRLLEGYGATECAPVIAANNRIQPCFGSVGRFLTGMEWKLELVEGVPEGGRLFVRGPNVMRGYLNAEANEKFLALGGWYDTGDLARVDDDGFLFLLGRLKRFAKVSGEMVSLTAVEDALAGGFPQYGVRCEVAVVSVPDFDKGEKLIAITNEARMTLDEIRAVIKAKGLTNLCVPRELRPVREIPKLGTGKVNHRELLAQLTSKPE